MEKLPRNLHASMMASARDLADLARHHWPQMGPSVYEELVAFAYGAHCRAVTLPDAEYRAVSKDFEAVAIEVGKALAGGATVEDALTRETPFCLGA